jgi:uncharacterized protein YrzB (UPF0473 family)
VYGLTGESNCIKLILHRSLIKLEPKELIGMPEEMEFGPDLLTLVDDEGVEHQFEVIDTLEIEDDRYIALIPVYDDAEDAVEDDGELILLKSEMEGEEEFLVAIEDEEEFNKVSEIFLDRLDEYYDIQES